MMAVVRTVLSLVAAMLLCACVAVETSADSTSSEPVEHVVEITGFKFIPETLSVKTGDTVTWINKDIAPHTASADNQSFDTGELKQNESGSITVSSDQTISYFCKYHPSMKAELSFE